MTSSARKKVIIVGGGVSGLSAAHVLVRAGLRPLLIEKESRFGGLIKTDLIEGCELEAGPDSFLAAKTAVALLARELGIEDRIIGSNDAERRIYIVKDGALTAMPPGMVFMVPGDLAAALESSFFSDQAKAAFRRELSFTPRTRHSDVSVREFVVDHFGEETLEYLTEPLLSGVYGGDAAGLSARSVLPRFVAYESAFGSLIRGVQRETAQPKERTSLFQSFRGGMQTLTDALERSVTPKAETIHAEAESVAKRPDGWRVRAGGQDFEAENLLLACPAYAAARLLGRTCPQLAGQLAAIPYSSALLAALVYDRAELGHPLNGFGFLVPSRERRGVAAATWVSTKFPSRTPANRAALRAFFVGSEANQLMNLDDAKLIDLVRKDYARLMNVSAAPLFSTVYRWPRSMPQYTVGHESRTAAIENATAAQPGLYLCGNAYSGVGIPDCIRLARERAERVLLRISDKS